MTDANLTGGTTYFYVVTAVTATGESSYSNEVSAMPSALSQSQVVQIAQNFCKAIGQPVSVPATAQFPVPEEYMNSTSPPVRHWQPRWSVTFPGQAELEIVDASSVVARYTNTASDQGNSDIPEQPAGAAIPQATAIQIAQAALAKTGQVDALDYSDTGDEVQFAYPATSDAHFWMFSFRRSSLGVPYADDAASVSLQAETGIVDNISLGYPTPPVSPVISLSQGQAESIAQSQIINAGIQGYSLDTSDTVILRPNGYWNNGTTDQYPSASPRAAWVVHFVQGDPADNIYYEVWVDAQTGEIVGGDEADGLNGAGTKRKPPQRRHMTVRKKSNAKLKHSMKSGGKKVIAKHTARKTKRRYKATK